MLRIIQTSFFCSFFILILETGYAQDFLFGADQSYVNEMEDCGADFKENNVSKDVYQIFEDHGCNLVRLRLWHTPSWYDALNSGRRYSDLPDVKKSIQRAKDHGMKVLLDFHLTDNWADPGSQLVPAAWLPVVNDQEVLQDSLYNYIYNVLITLKGENLLPEMVQIGNETNKGILLSPEQNSSWTLDWSRNAPLFNTAIQAVRDIDSDIEIGLHIADPAAVEWWIEQFTTNGVDEFDFIGISYYWAWHMPISIAETGAIIRRLRSSYPEKKVMIVETGYIWTTQFQDQANNNIGTVHPDYLPISPQNQKEWLIDLTFEVIASGGTGVIYWEPSWVSTSCSTQWGQGSHYENATFFDFDHNLHQPGGIEWMDYPYETISIESVQPNGHIMITTNSSRREVLIDISPGERLSKNRFFIYTGSGQLILSSPLETGKSTIHIPFANAGIYYISVYSEEMSVTEKVIFF